MKNKIARIISVALIIMIMGANVVFADNSQYRDIEPRSRYLAAGISEITNKGNGVLHIYADFTSYESVPWAQLIIKLERT